MFYWNFIIYISLYTVDEELMIGVMQFEILIVFYYCFYFVFLVIFFTLHDWNFVILNLSHILELKLHSIPCCGCGVRSPGW